MPTVFHHTPWPCFCCTIGLASECCLSPTPPSHCGLTGRGGSFISNFSKIFVHWKYLPFNHKILYQHLKQPKSGGDHSQWIHNLPIGGGRSCSYSEVPNKRRRRLSIFVLFPGSTILFRCRLLLNFIEINFRLQ